MDKIEHSDDLEEDNEVVDIIELLIKLDTFPLFTEFVVKGIKEKGSGGYKKHKWNENKIYNKIKKKRKTRFPIYSPRKTKLPVFSAARIKKNNSRKN